MATNLSTFRGLLKTTSLAVTLVPILAFSIWATVAAAQVTIVPRTPNATVTDAEVTAFMKAHERDAKALLTIQANPKRLPLLLGAIRKDPAGYWVGYLHGTCFIHDRAMAGRLPAAERPKVFAGVVQYLSAAQMTISNAFLKAPQNQLLKYNLSTIDKDLALVQADLGQRPNDTRTAIIPGSISNAAPRTGPTPARNANVAAARAKVCESHLTQIDLAREMWKNDHNKPETATPTATDLTYYIPYKIFPNCPDGGTYTIGRLNQKPTCSFPGHILPPRPR
jgi:hypothetical protein